MEIMVWKLGHWVWRWMALILALWRQEQEEYKREENLGYMQDLALKKMEKSLFRRIYVFYSFIHSFN